MATFIDKHQDEEENTQEEFASLDEDVEDVDPNEVIEEPAQANPEPQDDGLPDKYHGKSPEEIAKMHMEAEKLLGRQSSEVGELRRIVDDFVKAQLDTKTAPQYEEEDEVDWYSDPEKAVENAIAKHPKIKEAEQLSANMRQQTALSQLHERHPDFQQILQDKAFGEWVSNKSYKISRLENGFLSPRSGYSYSNRLMLNTTLKRLMNYFLHGKNVNSLLHRP